MIDRIEEMHDEDIIIVTKHEFSSDVLKKSRLDFTNFCNEGIIIDSIFSMNEWKIFDEKEYVNIFFDMDENIYNENSFPTTKVSMPDMINMIKSFIVFSIKKRILKTLQKNANCIKSVLGNLDNDRIYSPSEVELIEQFLQYISLDEDISEFILDNIERGKRRKAKEQRILGDVLSYFIHIEEINNVWNNGTEEERLYYFPLYFWANVTFIIPLRVTETTVTPYECIFPDSDGYKIVLRRSKLKGYRQYKSLNNIAYKVERDFYKVEYPIPKEIAENILYYKDKTKENPRPFLFDYELGRKSINKLYTSGAFRKLLSTFYEKYLVGNIKYRFALSTSCIKEIKRVSLGDSRHIAIINLQEQGQPLVRIKELAGHLDVNSTSHYASNTSDFIESMSLVSYNRLVQKYRLDKENLFDYLLAQNNENITGERCLSEKRMRDPNNIEDCIETGCMEDCTGCPFRKVGNYVIESEYKRFKEECIKADADLVKYIEKHREIKNFDNELDKLLLELQNKSSMFKDCCDTKYKGELQKWAEGATITHEI